MGRPVTVVVINSLSFTGTTWLNVVLGCHKRAFAIGPPDTRLWKKRYEDWDEACRLHGAECRIWPVFHQAYDPERNLFIQLAEFLCKDVLIINNPAKLGAATDLRHPDILTKPINLIRDGRAVVASFVRKNPQTSVLDAIVEFLNPNFQEFPFDTDNPDALSIRYEDAMANRLKMLRRVGDFVGVDYDEGALRFWEYEHHVAGGNAGLVAQIKLAQGISVGSFGEHEFYRSSFERMSQQSDPEFIDGRWKEQLSRRERFVFDVLCGEDNARFGYARDAFDMGEVRRFGAELMTAVDGGTVPEIYREEIREALMTEPARKRSPTRRAPATPTYVPSLREQIRLAWLWRNGFIVPPEDLKTIAMFVKRRGFVLTSGKMKTILIFSSVFVVALITFSFFLVIRLLD